MKITLFKILAITLIIGVFSIPVFASATVPIESSVPVAPIASGQNTGGASAVTVPNTQGQNTGGATTATIPATVVIPPTETKNVSSGGCSISGGRGFVSFGSGGS